MRLSLPTSLGGGKREGGGGGGGGERGFLERSRVSVIIMIRARAVPKEGMLLALSCQATREAFVN